jgi:methylmalonyl-CoA/ethylmalonyl-CoA epimerase
MNRFHLSFHHLGLAVSEPEKAVSFLTSLGYTCQDRVEDPEQNVNLIMCVHEGGLFPDVEIIFPAQTPGPLDGLLKRNREAIYHICYETRNVTSSIEAIRARGGHISCLSSPKPAVLFGGKEVSFYYVEGFGVIEMLQAGSNSAFT